MFPWSPRGPGAQGRAHGGRAQGRLGLSPRSGVHRRVETFSATGRPSLSGSLTTPRDSAPGHGLPSSDPCAWGSDSGEPRVRVLWGGFKAECPGKGLQQISPVCTQDRQFEYFNCFPGGHDLFDLKRKGGRGNFFQAITTCYMYITTMYCAHIFQVSHTLKYLLDRTLAPVLPMQPTISSSTTHPLRTHFPSTQCHFPKSGKDPASLDMGQKKKKGHVLTLGSC